MNKVVAEYVVVVSNLVTKLSYEVQKCISKGWQPIGGVCFDGMQYIQAMVKYKEKKEE